MKGWVKLHRKLVESELHKNSKPFCEFGAWIDMILMANWCDNGDIKRGEFPTHIRTLAARWGWSVSKVNRYLAKLSTGSKIGSKSDQKRIIIRIEKYEEYQTDMLEPGSLTGSQPGSGSDQESDPSIRRDLYKKKEYNNTPLPPKGEVPRKRTQKPSVTFQDVECFVPVNWSTDAREALASWLDYHRETLKKPYRDPRYVCDLVKRFESRPADFARAVTFSKSNMYQGLIEDRSYRNVERVDFKTIEIENKAKRERAAAEIAQASIDAWNNVSKVARIGGPKNER